MIQIIRPVAFYRRFRRSSGLQLYLVVNYHDVVMNEPIRLDGGSIKILGRRMLGIFSRRKQTRVTVGARYQNAEMSLLVWEVASIFNGIDGTPYAHIFCVSDTSRRKTVAQSALESGVQYKRLIHSAESA